MKLPQAKRLKFKQKLPVSGKTMEKYTLPKKSHTIKKIALFSGAYQHIVDGVSLTLNRLVAFLESEGIEVMVFAPGVENPPLIPNGNFQKVPSIPFPGRKEYRLNIGMTPKQKKALKDFAPDIFHIATPDFMGKQALRLAGKWNIPAVSTYHTHFASYLQYYKLKFLDPFVWKYLKKFYDRCNQIYVPTLSIAEELRSHRIQKNLKIWPRGINAELFIPSRRSEKWRKNLGVESHEILISFVSRLVLEKGLNVFISVIRELKKKNIPHKCVIVGEGPAKPVLQKEIPHAVFTGYLKGEDLATAYASSDIFLFPSPTETFGNVVLEAMACGVPVVGANAGGSRSLIRHGKTGYLANPEDAEDFIRYVVTLMEDEILRQQFSTRARMESKDYCWEKILKRMIHYYQETVSRFAPSPFQRG